MNEKADPAHAQALLPELAGRGAGDRQTFLLGRIFLALLARDKADVDRALALIPRGGITSNIGPCPRAFYEGLVAACFGEKMRAQAASAAARPDVAKSLQADPEYAEHRRKSDVLLSGRRGAGRRKDLAIEYLERVSTVPCGVVSYGWVKLLPLFDFLRGDAKFAQVAERFKRPVPE